MISALFGYIEFFLGLPEDFQGHPVLENFARIIEPWNAWFGLPLNTNNRNIHTFLFIYMGSLSIPSFKVCQGHPSGPPGGRYRLMCVEPPPIGSDSPKMLFSVNIDPSIELWDGPVFLDRKRADEPLEIAELEHEELDVLVDAVRQSMELDEDQKDRMIEGIRAFRTT